MSSLSHIATLHFLQSIEIIYGSFYKLSHARKFLTQKIYHIVFALFLKILEFPSGPSINKVRTLKFGDFRHHLPSCTLLNNRMKSENRCRLLPWPPPSPLERTYFVDGHFVIHMVFSVFDFTATTNFSKILA